MSTTTSDSTIKGKYDEVAGKVKQGVGEMFGSDKVANEGATQQVKGHVEQAWGSVKEAASDTKDRNQPKAEASAHDVRESITSTAQNVKEHIQHGVESFRTNGDDRK